MLLFYILSLLLPLLFLLFPFFLFLFLVYPCIFISPYEHLFLLYLLLSVLLDQPRPEPLQELLELRVEPPHLVLVVSPISALYHFNVLYVPSILYPVLVWLDLTTIIKKRLTYLMWYIFRPLAKGRLFQYSKVCVLGCSFMVSVFA